MNNNDKINILELYNTLKESIKKTLKISEETQERSVPEELLGPITESFTEIINFIKTHLITSQDSFYGNMWLSMDTEINYKIRGPIDIDVSKQPFVLMFNPLFCADIKFIELEGLIVSEILRLVYDHPSTFALINPDNDAAKHEHLEKGSSVSVSDMVRNEIRLNRDNVSSPPLKLPSDFFTVTKMAQEIGRVPSKNEAMEYYYKMLEKFDNKPQNPQNGNVGSSKENGTATPNNSDGQGTRQWEKQNPEETKEAIKSLVKEVYDSMDNKARGSMPSSIVEQIEKLLKTPELNWKQILRKYIGSIPVPYRKTKTRPNRREPERFDLSGRLPKRIARLVVAIDTSGSMSDKMIAYAMNEIFEITKNHEAEITIIECDAEIGKIYKVKKMSDVQTKVTGRGGTRFTPVIEYLNENRYRDAVMIYFTDGYGEYEIPKPRTYRNLWVVVRGDVTDLSLKEPYGEVKALKMDQDWVKNMKESDGWF